MRVAVLGAGMMGSVHARAWQATPGVEIAAIYARTGERAHPLAEAVGTTWTNNLAAVLDDASIMAVDVCLPSPLHRQATEAALEAGKHVLLEKPIALTEADARAIVQRAEEAGRIFMVAHVLRFWPEYVELQRQLASGTFGAPRSLLATRRQTFPAWSTLFANVEMTGGAVVDMLIHDFDAANWALGMPRAVTARGRRGERSGGFDHVQVLIDYGDGVSALVDGGMEMPASYPFSSRLEVRGALGALEYHFQAGGRGFEEGAGINRLTLYPATGEPVIATVEQVDPFVAEIAYFADCIRTGQRPTRVTADDAVLALRVALAARDSIELGGATMWLHHPESG